MDVNAALILVRTGLFAEGRFLGRLLDEWINDAQEFIRSKLPHLIIIAVIAFILMRLLRIITLRMIHVAERHAADDLRIAQVKTLSGVIRTTGFTIIGLIAGFSALAAIDINLGPLLASAGIAGVAIGLAAQTIVKDVLNGILILVEDQFNVGDTVKIAGVGGVVESMTLRKTSVRDPDGTLYAIPNSQITTVANQSAGFSVATVNVSVDFSAHPDEVSKLLTKIASDIRNSDEFKPVMVADPQVLGVDAIKGSELIFPVVFKTLATKQYGPIREFRRRVRLALEEQNMLPGNPYHVISNFQRRTQGAEKVAPQVSAPEQDPTTLKPLESNPFSGE
jgi:moderate conductance mechanosensitive channel